ncbi:putative calcium-transporting ATPase 13, plasma membrane-type isoform X1 [Rosa chinensis]|uniref:putative calcium-transporting ATPase 13, plasma membrane-type isoform X1 n=1 Tax=Rosa chinensis TaxID=74649 RepID=UPI000D0966A3|nr:putative calcium-transporting ATPase 13, plasma membrane-type isoform X1 [Rosa chinensis]
MSCRGTVHDNNRLMDMSKDNPGGVDHKDLESQQTVSKELELVPIDPNRRWRTIVLILQARHIFITLAAAKNPELGSLTGDLEVTITPNPTPPEGVTANVYSDNPNDSEYQLQFATISNIIKTKDLTSLHDFGGAQAFAEALGSDLETGIPTNDEATCCRLKSTTNSTTPEQAAARGFIQLAKIYCNSYMILLLFVAAVLSLCFGIVEEGPMTGWFEGAIILDAIIMLVVLPSIRDYWRESKGLSGRQKLLENTDEVEVEVLRGGNEEKISSSDILFGDIVWLKRGHQVPADGLFISGGFVVLDDQLGAVVDADNPFLFYGAEVIDGNGRMLVTSVGVNTVWGDMMSSINHLKKTPLEAQLDRVNTCMQIIGLLISILILVVLFLRFELKKELHTGASMDLRGEPTKMNMFMDAIKKIVMKPSGKISILTTSLTVMLVGIVEGLPFCINLAIIYWNRKALNGMASLQHLLACVTMASVTSICTDKNGGLTLDSMEVDMCWIGEQVMAENSVIASNVLEAFRDGISMLLLSQPPPYTSIEDPVISWAALKLGMELEIVRQSNTIVEDKELTTDQEGRGAMMRKNRDSERERMYLHCRGPATSILPICSHYHDCKGMINVIEERNRVTFHRNVEDMQSKHLKTMAFAYKEIDVPTMEERDLILLGLVGLKSCLEKMRESIRAIRNAGVNIILVSGDDVQTLVSIAEHFRIQGVPISNEMVTTGEKFRNCSDEDRMKMVSEISVMGNSLPSDKLLLVKCLKQKGETVAVIGVKTNEAPALKEADVGLTMGIWTTKMAKASSDIILRVADISCLVSILRHGRCAYYNIQKYIQLELTIVAAGLLVTFIIAASTGNMPITSIQLFWVNLVVPMLGGLALLTELPRKKLMEKSQSGQTKAIITMAMCRNIIIQASYQAVTIVTFHFKGQAILGVDEKVRKTIIFNSFVICQIFNKFSARELVKKNVFKAIHKNQWFWVALAAILVLQLSFIEISHVVAGDARLSLVHWGFCLLIGIVSLGMDIAAKGIYDYISSFVE